MLIRNQGLEKKKRKNEERKMKKMKRKIMAIDVGKEKKRESHPVNWILGGLW